VQHGDLEQHGAGQGTDPVALADQAEHAGPGEVDQGGLAPDRRGALGDLLGHGGQFLVVFDGRVGAHVEQDRGRERGPAGPRRSRRKSGSAGRRSQTRRRRSAMAQSRCGPGHWRTAASRCSSETLRALWRTAARCSRWRSRCRSRVRTAALRVWIRMATVMPTDSSTMPTAVSTSMSW
jgi:hypothetical protein